jgi:hypothetical protein
VDVIAAIVAAVMSGPPSPADVFFALGPKPDLS